jgi:hypothetical protein
MKKKVYITKNCLTQGIVYDEVFIIDPIKKIAKTKAFSLLKKNDFFFDIEKAFENAELRKSKRIKQIEKNLKNINSIKFSIIKK